MDGYSEQIKTYSGKSYQTAQFDASNLLLIEKKRGDNARNITDTKYFFVSVDQKLRNWDFQRNDLQPTTLLPSQWMSILLKYFSRTDNDYRSFVSFLQLRLQNPVIQEEEMHFILTGISEVTEDFNRQKEIFDAMIELQFQKTLEDKTEIEIKEESIRFARNLMDNEISGIKIQHSQEKTNLQKSHTETVLAHKRRLLKEQEDSLSSINTTRISVDTIVETKIRNVKLFISAYFIGVFFLALISIYVFNSWDKVEPFAFVVGLFFVALGVVYLIIKNEEFDLSKYIPNLKNKYFKAESEKLGFNEERQKMLYETIPKLKTEIEQLKEKVSERSKHK